MKIIFGSLLVFLTVSGIALAGKNSNIDNFLILGVIASTEQQAGVALMKNKASNKTFAVKAGSSFSSGAYLVRVNRKHVDISINGTEYTLKVGAETANAIRTHPQVNTKFEFAQAQGSIEKDGQTITVGKDYKDHLLNNNLAQILMQAAAIPYEINGKLRGFQLWDIEKDSVFKLVGLDDGDIITAIKNIGRSNFPSPGKNHIFWVF